MVCMSPKVSVTSVPPVPAGTALPMADIRMITISISSATGVIHAAIFLIPNHDLIFLVSLLLLLTIPSVSPGTVFIIVLMCFPYLLPT